VRQQAEAIAQASAQRFQQLFENAPVAIFEIALTPALKILDANRQATLIYGWSAAEFTQLSPERLLSLEAEPALSGMLAQVRAGQTITLETTHLRRDGSPFPVRLNATPDQMNGAPHLIVTAQDITAELRHRSETEAIAADRRRIAREMHDSLAQTLAGLRLRTRLWQRILDQDPTQLHPELDELRDVLDESIAEVRRSIFALRPLKLEELGFFPALRQFVDDFSTQYRLPVQLAISGPEERLPSEIELNLFRAVQESLNNVARHAQADAVDLCMDCTGSDQIHLVVSDNGRGFDPAGLAEQSQTGHFGLKQMRERMEAINGVLLIFSAPGQGTRLEMTIPLLNWTGGGAMKGNVS
jgi:PAS domain S-box-containing protein